MNASRELVLKRTLVKVFIAAFGCQSTARCFGEAWQC
jgi:hypothetical protein